MLRSTILLLIGAFSIQTIQCKNLPTDLKRSPMSAKILEFVRFNLAQRVDHKRHSIEAEITIEQLSNTTLGQEELKAIHKHQSYLIKSAFTENPIKENSKGLKDGCQSEIRIRDIFDQVEFYTKEFSIDLSLGLVRIWPRYYYDQDAKSIIVLPEILQLNPDLISTELYDLGPPVPVFEELQNPLEETKIQKGPMWVSNTPPILKNPDLYELGYIIPLQVLAGFYELVSSTFNKLNDRKYQKVMAPLRILKRSSDAVDRIRASMELTSNEFDEPEFNYNMKKCVLWAPGNSYYSFKDREHKVGQDKLDTRLEVVIGTSRLRKAEDIHNRIIRFMKLVNYGVYPKLNKDQLDKIAEHIVSDEDWFDSITELFFQVVYFGLGRRSPYRIDVNQWKRTRHRELWTWELKSIDEYGYPSKGVADNSAFFKFQALCYGERFLVRSVLTNRTHTSMVFNQFQQKHPELASANLSDINDFVASKLRDSVHLERSRMEKWCRNDVIVLESEDSSESLIVDLSDVVGSMGFEDWCNGVRYRRKGMVTTDSAFVRVMTYNSSVENRLNVDTLSDLQNDFMLSSRPDSDITFFEYVEDQLQRVNSKANRILNEACNDYERKKNHRGKKNEEKALGKSWVKQGMEMLEGALIFFEGSPMDDFKMRQVHYGDLRR